MFFYWGVVVAQSASIGIWRGVNHCGDGVLRVDLGEMCDDGNYVDGDGCSANCEDESIVVQAQDDRSWAYKNVNVSETTPYKVFMNGAFSHTIDVVKGTEGEICDYGIQNGVVCEPWYGWVCYYCSETCVLEEVRWFSCGDGIVYHVYEECDDGNTLNGDGCSSSCKKENIHSFVPGTAVSVVDQTTQPIAVVTWTKVPLQQPVQQPVQNPLQNNAQASTGQIIEWQTVEPSQAISNPLPQPNLWILQPIHSLMPTELPEPSVPLTTPKPVVVVDAKALQPKPTLVVTNKPLPEIVEDLPLSVTEPVISVDTPELIESEWKALTLESTPVLSSTPMVSTPSRHLVDIQVRQNIAMRTTTQKEGIWITTPYPEVLSKTWADLKVSSFHVFMLLFSWLLTCYFGFVLFASNSLKIDNN